MENIQAIKQRFGIIGNDAKLNRAIETAIQVAPTDISVLVTGESGVGKEAIPKIIHALSLRKHGKYIAVNCGAIPEGTIDSELFGHEKGAFTGATSTRSGYFEEADGGTIFLDEVGELPLTTQVRLLRVLENGEFIKVGSSVVQKTNVRIVAATNLNMFEAIKKGRFREDLFYRLSTVQIHLPALRDRKDDIYLLFRKFASDTAEKYKMPTPIRLTEDAVHLLVNYRWSGNIRQLRNVAEQISVLEQKREVSSAVLQHYLPNETHSLPTIVNASRPENDFSNEREILYKVLFDMKNDLNDLKKLTLELLQNGNYQQVEENHKGLIHRIYGEGTHTVDAAPVVSIIPVERVQPVRDVSDKEELYDYEEDIEEEPVSLQDKERELIIKSLERNGGKRKEAAKELGISERTLYRKIKQFDLDL
ncbi:sigma-54-dependent Fis family transcriptional regulator [Capnocytophaga sp.]|uniref:sigma-54 interaction domain-containing protein n=1 Tax=Capnocytophaga sp. TaxID=44737 RepID=UPI0026DB6D56|nr:sigma-54 dependent transcriptional regulator [Capnocytophaga sp.]MDO5104429.1 sigma-54 dependent transcriptional regulator [Capnocytophaga sp.]